MGRQNRELESTRSPAIEDVSIVLINPNNQEHVQIGSLLQSNKKDQFLNLLQMNRDVFALKHEDMTGV